MGDRDAGFLEREAFALEIELNASEFQGTEWIQEEAPEGLIPRFEAPQYVGSALRRELLPEPLVEIAPQGYTSADAKVETGQVLLAHPSRAITSPKCFGALTALDEQEVADPWTSQDPWTRVESITGSVDSLPPLSAEFARQNAEMDAARLDIVFLLPLIRCLGGCPPPLMSQARKAKHQSAKARGCNSPSPPPRQGQKEGPGGLMVGIGGKSTRPRLHFHTRVGMFSRPTRRLRRPRSLLDHRPVRFLYMIQHLYLPLTISLQS